MGAEFLAHTYDYCDTQTLEQQVEYDTEQMMYEGGCSYSGNWAAKDRGIIYENPTFNSVDEAEDWIADNNDKWGMLSAVKVPDTNQKDDTKLLALTNKRIELNVAVDNVITSIIKSMQDVKASTRKCKNCGSSIATKYIDRLNCPVCDAFLASSTASAKLTAARNRYNKSNQVVLDFKPTGSTSKWVVGGNCSS